MKANGSALGSGACGKAVAGWVAGLCAAWALAACGGGGGGGGSAPPAVTPVVVAPGIGAQPADAKVVDGNTATFSVSATGSSLSYQWQRDGQSIAGATGASYTTPVLHMADNNARFQVVVSGPGTSVTSSVASLTVTPIALNLTTQPAAQAAKDGDVVSFDVVATGSEPIQYQWQRNGAAIQGADKATYTTSALVLADDAAVFTVVVTNAAGSVTSQAAKLNVAAVPPRIVTVPESVTTTDGAAVTFKVTAAGSAPLAYQWLRNGSAISGATDSSYATTLAYAGSGDRYTVQIANSAGQIVSAAAVATVNPNAPAITGHPADASIGTGGSASFTVTATGTAPLSYQWQQSQDQGLSWKPVAGATSATYAVSDATLANANTRLRVVISNPASTLNSNVALLAVRPNVRILAGIQGGSGYADGKGSAARFGYAAGLGADASGNIYVAESGMNVIRRVSPDGTVKLFAGEPRTAGHTDGPLAQARLSYPLDVAVDRAGAVYIAENCYVRRIDAGKVTTFAGDGSCVTRDGNASQASLGQATGLAVDGDGNVFVTERTNANGQVVRKITPAGAMSTVAGSAAETGKVDGVGTAARFMNIGKLTVDASNNVFVADGPAVRRITPAGDVTTYAGAMDTPGQVEGFRTAARFNYITALAFDAAGNLFLTDYDRISRISIAGNVVTAVSRAPGNDIPPTSIDGPAGTAAPGMVTAMTRLPDGNIAFFDVSAFAVRLMTPAATLTTLVGGGRTAGFADGVGAAARFSSQSGFFSALVVDPAGALKLADNYNRRIRRLTLGSNRLDTWAGTGTYGFGDGTAATATFNVPLGLTHDAAGNLYVSDGAVIRRISAAGIVTTHAGQAFDWGNVDGPRASARFNNVTAMGVDSRGNLIVGDNGTIRRIAPDGMVTTLAGKAGDWSTVNGKGSEARISFLKYLVIDAADNVYFTDSSNAIRKMTPDGDVGPAAGAPFSSGFADDLGAFARFNQPSGLAFDARGNLYVADTGNNAIRRITPDSQVTTVIGDPASVSAVLQPGLNGRINAPTALAVTAAGRLVFLSEGAIVGD
ncbi:MAG: hypothetical protein EOP39_09380 [Rubrivivax sp.]|nr:MAG: hypothetical protein EOP39_09380 [Rubrivivax sp.]